MKKKLLSLLMAGAVVAGTTMPAYAQTYQANDSQTINASVTVTGMVDNAQGIAPSGKIQVEVPTALSFTVDNQGRLTAGNFTISNKSQSSIDVKVGSFQETKLAGSTDPGITLHDNITNFKTLDRSNVVLVLRHGSTDVILQHGMSETPLVTIAGGKSENVQVLGTAGTATAGTNQDVDKAGASETFDLVFKISKHN